MLFMEFTRFEDVEIGDTFGHGAYYVSEDDMKNFSNEFEPGTFTGSPQTVSSPSISGVASGWHIASIMMRVLVEDLSTDDTEFHSTGFDNLRWEEPVRPDDTLSVQSEVVGINPQNDEADRGIIEMDLTITNQNEERVMFMTGQLSHGQKR